MRRRRRKRDHTARRVSTPVFLAVLAVVLIIFLAVLALIFYIANSAGFV